MNVEDINPFIEAVEELFTTMLDSKVQRGELTATRSNQTVHDVTALIGLSGRTKGIVIVSFPKSTALKVVSKFLGEEHKTLDSEVTDAVAEAVNIIAGSAKAKLQVRDGQAPIELSLPTVIMGKNCQIDPPSSATWLEVPHTSDLGDFMLRVSFESK